MKTRGVPRQYLYLYIHLQKAFPPGIQTSPLNPRIILQDPFRNIHLLVIPPPLLAPISKPRQHPGPLQQPPNLTPLLNKLQRKSCARMPRDMTMHQPRPRIIDLERNPHPPANRTINHISPRGIIQLRQHVLVEDALPLSEDDEIVAVQMDGVDGARERLGDGGGGEGIVVFDDEVDPFARLVVEFHGRGPWIEHHAFGVRFAKVLQCGHPPVDILRPVRERPFVD